jgi:hypothetical protein
VYIGPRRVYFALGVFAVSCSDYNTLIEVSLVTLYGFATYTFGSDNFKLKYNTGEELLMHSITTAHCSFSLFNQEKLLSVYTHHP